MMVIISRYSVLAFVYTVILACSVRTFFALAEQQRQAVAKTVQRPIRVALSVDEQSLKDFLIVMSAVVNAAENPSRIIFHLVACAKDIEAAKALQIQVSSAIKSCFQSTVKYHSVPFTLPPDSGFALQLKAAKKFSHWVSSSGADMVRFYLPSLFPKVRRLLYLDNDVTVTCCLEEVWGTRMTESQIVGIALDDLKWATVTQFKGHYNASHPLVIQNIRHNRTQTTDPTTDITQQNLQGAEGALEESPVTQEEFWRAVPKYPNDGVLLVDVQKYNREGVLSVVDELARANGRGEYCVGLGTQQFTVLALHDRWVELTPRANLRHFPNMARGYLMWFYYNGFIHYAGQSKPRSICDNKGTDNELRMNTYTPWATALVTLKDTCSPETFQLMKAENCSDFIPNPVNFRDFMRLVGLLASVSRDDNLWHLRLGGVNTDFTGVIPYKNTGIPKKPGKSGKGEKAEPIVKVVEETNVKNIRDVANSMNNMYDFLGSDIRRVRGRNGVEQLDILIVQNSSFSIRVFDRSLVRIVESGKAFDQMPGFKKTILDFKIPASAVNSGNNRNIRKNRKNRKLTEKKGKKTRVKEGRTWGVQHMDLCDGTQIGPIGNTGGIEEIKNTKERGDKETIGIVSGGEGGGGVGGGGNESALVIGGEGVGPGVGPGPCVDVLQEIKAQGKNHWDLIGVTIDLQPSQLIPMSNSLDTLKSLDLVFIRPKYIFVRIGPRTYADLTVSTVSTASALLEDVRYAVRYLKRTGFMVSQEGEEEDLCGEGEGSVGVGVGGIVRSEGQENGENGEKRAKGEKGQKRYICVWGTRMNEFEFSGEKWGKW